MPDAIDLQRTLRCLNEGRPLLFARKRTERDEDRSRARQGQSQN